MEILTPVAWVSLFLQVAILVAGEFLPPVYPESLGKVLRIVVGATALALTFLGISLSPARLPLGLPELSAIVLMLSLLSPIAGMIEGRYWRGGSDVYSRSRLVGHVRTNILGAFAVVGFVQLARSTAGFSAFVYEFANDASFNILLPLSMMLILAFVRHQQIEACGDIDERVKRSDPGWERHIAGFSLRHLHQFLNATYLIAAIFTVASTLLFLFAFALTQAKAGQPLVVSWKTFVPIVAALAFLFACGLPASRQNRAVFLTFLTGAPATLCAALVWLSLFQSSVMRNVGALAIVLVGYAVYSLEVILEVRSRGGRLEVHYFAAVGMVFVLSMLLGALYFS